MSSFAFSACGSKPAPAPTPTPAPRVLEMKAEDKPIVKLIPRSDGHLLKLVIDKIPSYVKQIEYELLYIATDNGNIEIEKGLGDTLKVDSSTLSRDLLLGTESCTSGCKYKYDNGVSAGTISLTLITDNNQVASYQAPFSLQTGQQIKKDKGKYYVSLKDMRDNDVLFSSSEF